MTHTLTEQDRRFLAALRIGFGDADIVTDPELASREEVERIVAGSGWCNCDICRKLRGENLEGFLRRLFGG